MTRESEGDGGVFMKGVPGKRPLGTLYGGEKGTARRGYSIESFTRDDERREGS